MELSSLQLIHSRHWNKAIGRVLFLLFMHTPHGVQSINQLNIKPFCFVLLFREAFHLRGMLHYFPAPCGEKA